MFNFIKQNTQKLKESVGSQLSQVQISKYYENVKKFIEDEDEEAGNDYEVLTNMTQSDKLQIIINKTSNISDAEKQFIFNYAKQSPEKNQTGESIDKFAKNLIIVINSFFEYGFAEQSTETSGNSVKHYWDLIAQYFNSYSSVAYIQEFLGQTQKGPECALSWISLVLNEENVLFYCFHEIFKNQDFLSHYNSTYSYFHVNRIDLLDISKSIYQHKIVINSKFNQKYQEYLKESLKIRLEQNLRQQQLQAEQQKREKIMIVHEEASDEGEEFGSGSGSGEKDSRGQNMFREALSEREEDNPQESVQENQFNNNYQKQQLIRKSSFQEALEEDKFEMDLIVEESKFNFFTERNHHADGQGRLNLFSNNENLEKKGINSSHYRSIKNDFSLGYYEEPSKATLNSNAFQSNTIPNESRFEEEQSAMVNPYIAIKHYSKNHMIHQRYSPTRSEKDSLDKRSKKQSPRKIEQRYKNTAKPQISTLLSLQMSPDFSTTSSQIRPNKYASGRVRKTEKINNNNNNSFDSENDPQKQLQVYEKGHTYYISPRNQNNRTGTFKQLNTLNKKPIELTNSDCAFFNEFLQTLKIKEYNQRNVHKFFGQITSRINKKKNCHNCGTKFTLGKMFSKQTCNFCLEYVCSKECLSTEKFIIPRAFNLQYDLEEKQVCQLAGMFLNRRNFLKIPNSHPQVALQDKLYQFMIARRRLHKIFDLIKCDMYVNIIEKNGFASEKNLILKDFFISIQQLCQYRQGVLHSKVIQMSNVMLVHLKSCNVCDIKKNQCEICLGGVLFYEYDIEIAGECNECKKKGHLSCLNKHQCNSYILNF